MENSAFCGVFCYIFNMENNTLDLGHWTVKDGVSKNIPDGTIGFVYIIKDNHGKLYIGKKLLQNKKKRKPLKGRVNARRYVVESDWKTYCGSNPELNKYIETNGKNGIEFVILHWCDSKLMLGYLEAKEIIESGALFSKDYYNEVLNVRFRLHRDKKV